jgi:hypothetical protein
LKKWIHSLLVSGAMLGTLSVPTAVGAAASAYASTSTPAQEQLQLEITDALNQRLSSFEATYSGNMKSLKKDVTNMVSAAMNSDDYLHYIVKKYSYTAKIKGDTATITFNFTYWETLAQTNEVQNRIAGILSEIVTPDMNDHQKEKAIHDWVVSHIAYDKKLVSHSAYDGLVNGKTVCQGYALITYEMMKQAGIPVKIIEGSARGVAHAWNLVQIDGSWYHLDSTWDDPAPDVAGRVLYNYYNVTDAQLRADHAWKASALYPSVTTPYDQTLTALIGTDPANAEFYNALYDAMGYAYLADENTASNLAALTSKISAAVDNNQEQLVIRYAKGTTVVSDMKKAMASQKGLSGYSYSREPFTRTTEKDELLHIAFKYGDTATKK